MHDQPAPNVAVCDTQQQPARYPPAKVPLTPTICRAGFKGKGISCPSLLDMPHVPVSAGRAGITLALQHASIGAGDEVLVPAYHCESMVAPVEHVGATPVYYRIGLDTLANIDDVTRKITPRTRAILATHYFGFPQSIAALRSLCDQHGLILIEDCAHAFFGDNDGDALGSLGDYAVGSAMKFFPLFDGGVLVSMRHDLSSIKLYQPPFAMELKGLISIVEYAVYYGRLRTLRLPLKLGISLKDVLWQTAKRAFSKKLNHSFAPASSEGGYALEPQWIEAKMSRISQRIMLSSNTARICTLRRRNYRRIVEALENVTELQALFPELPDGVVPLVVPMLASNPASLFPRLKHAGVPIWRFGEYLSPEIDDSVCPNTLHLSRHVFQFPCHPELRDEEINWMVDTIRQETANDFSN